VLSVVIGAAIDRQCALVRTSVLAVISSRLNPSKGDIGLESRLGSIHDSDSTLMLIKHTPDAYEKLQLLGGMATDDDFDKLNPYSIPPGWEERQSVQSTLISTSSILDSSQDKSPIPVGAESSL
jgi:hypothetical protein